ncbi:MerR family transcriptional regulator [Agarilytica rhodophyticola]|uniref:MerR family transcriptional regulator n=1 Tax=Agarilytica rhodophyticola TaxID=1737490 RepID=UPI000B347E01|nr:MerR family transcriptional regulator [Agarilytica rhodophyticola]
MKIKELSEKSGLSAHTIRYYEKIHLLQTPSKDTSGHRNYNNDDLELINWVACLKNSGMSLQKIKDYTHAYHQQENRTLMTILELHLSKLKRQETDIKHYIDVTEQKIKRLKNP